MNSSIDIFITVPEQEQDPSAQGLSARISQQVNATLGVQTGVSVFDVPNRSDLRRIVVEGIPNDVRTQFGHVLHNLKITQAFNPEDEEATIEYFVHP